MFKHVAWKALKARIDMYESIRISSTHNEQIKILELKIIIKQKDTKILNYRVPVVDTAISIISCCRKIRHGLKFCYTGSLPGCLENCPSKRAHSITSLML